MSIHRTLATLLAGAALAASVSALADRPDPVLQPFEVQITVVADGLQLRCEAGCTWTELSYDCGPRPCSAQLTHAGIDGLPSARTGADD